MRIILHGGFHKTGTTSLQGALGVHGPVLADRVQVMTLKTAPGLALATEAARDFSRGGDAAVMQAAMTTWAEGLADFGGRDLVISSEDFAGHMPGRFGLADYRAAVTTLPAAVAALRARFAGAEIAVLMTVRAAEGWLKSLHWQLSKHPELTLKQRRFCREYAEAARFEGVLDPLATALQGLAALHVVPLEALAERRLGPVEAIYDLLALPDARREALPPPAARNMRVTDGLADQFVMLNRAKLPAAELRRAKSAMQGMMQALDEP